MSAEWRDAVWKDAKLLAGSDLLVMLVIAEHANGDGVCWPSVERIAERARLSVRQTQRILSRLEIFGYLERDYTGGRGHKTIYQVQPAHLWPTSDSVKGDIYDTQSTPKDDARDTQSTLKGDIQRAERVTSSALKGDIAPHTRDEPSIEPSIEPVVAADLRGRAKAAAAAPSPSRKESRASIGRAKDTFVAAYEYAWGRLVANETEGEIIADWSTRVTLDGWKFALRESAKAHATNLRYLEKILQRIEREGYLPEGVTSPPQASAPAQVAYTLEDVYA